MNEIESLSTILQLPLRQLEADVHDIAWSWESVMESNTGSIKQAIITLFHLASVYLRGRGYRMGNYQGLRKNGFKAAMLCTEVARYVVGEGNIIFPSLHLLGFSSLDSTLEIIARGLATTQIDIIAEANRILRQKRGE